MFLKNYYDTAIDNVMIVGTTQAARILNISPARLRVILIQGRVEGAYKTGKMWLIPLFNGQPIITKGTRGPTPKWRNPRKPAKTIVHVNTHKIKKNQQQSVKEPVITVKKGDNNQYGYEALIPGGCRVVYDPDRSRYGGARVWIESLYDVIVIPSRSPQLALGS